MFLHLETEKNWFLFWKQRHKDAEHFSCRKAAWRAFSSSAISQCFSSAKTKHGATLYEMHEMWTEVALYGTVSVPQKKQRMVYKGILLATGGQY